MGTSHSTARRKHAAPTVLIAEDDPFIAMTVEDAVVDAGFDVVGVAASEKEAVALGDAAEPDLAVVDVRLRPGDGKAVARALSSRHDTGVLMASAEDAANLNHIGAVAALTKPYSAAEVPAALTLVEAIKKGEEPVDFPEHLTRLRA